VETHGTGTTLGDPIEVQALGDVFSASHHQHNPLWISSVKTNVGHLEAAAGIVGLIKVVLALQHQTIPPHLHFREPNPYIDWANLPVKVPTTAVPWESPTGQRRMAGLSSFGFSGTNSHMVIAEAPETAVPSAPDKDAYLLPLSAKSEKALREMARQTAVALQTNPNARLADAAYTLAVGRDHFDHRLALLASDTADAAAQKLTDWLETGALPDGWQGQRPKSGPPEVAFLFTGQGAQYVQMGRQLFTTEPVFRQVMEECAAILRPFLPHPLLDVIYPPADAAPEDGRPD
jgi:acyl transferase domain-containing protein